MALGGSRMMVAADHDDDDNDDDDHVGSTARPFDFLLHSSNKSNCKYLRMNANKFTYFILYLLKSYF